MQRYSDTILNQNGRPVANARVVVDAYVKDAPANLTGISTSTICALDGGPAVQFVTSDAKGRFSFYAADGHYSLTFTGNGLTAALLSDVTLNDPDNDVKLAGFTQSGNAAVLASAVAAQPGGTLLITTAGDDTALPETYENVLLDYTGTHPLRTTHTGIATGTAKRTFKGQFPANHPDTKWAIQNIEAQSQGSGKNGPASADYGMTIAVHKKGYAGTTSPPAGEIDGLSISIRQDGPKGQAAASAGSSDATGVLVNIQNVEDVGFTSAWEAATSNYNRGTGLIPKSIQTQIGVLDMNQIGTPSYGFVAVSTAGVNSHAYYAGNGGGTWMNLFFSPNALRIDASGNYYAPTADWTNGAWSIARTAGVNGTTQITNRGTGALFLFAQDAGAIQFGTNGALRWQINSAGALHPTTNLSGDIGTPTRRMSELWALQIDLGDTSTNGIKIRSGSGTPEGVVAAPVGTMYLRRDGGPGTTLYIKESGTGNTGWAAK